MKTIETTINVHSDRTATLRVPDDISPGEHHAVIVVEQNGANLPPSSPMDLPTHDVGPWPAGYLVRREELYDDEP